MVRDSILIKDRIKEFRDSLKTHEPLDIVRMYLINPGTCFVINESDLNNLKKIVSNHFSLHPNEIAIVGSAKLGFSIAPDKRYQKFSDLSDIDIAICSSELFDEIWKSVYDYWRRESWSESKEFQKYLFRGWIRPDKLPNVPSFGMRREWWEFFRKLTNSKKYGPYSIRGGLYKSWHFLENYQLTAVERCIDEENKQV